MYTHILAAIDGSATSGHAFDTALKLASEMGASLQPVYVIDTPSIAMGTPGYDPSIVRQALCDEGKRVLADALAKMLRDGVQGATRLIEASPVGDDIAQCVLRAASEFNADLIIMGTHGRRGFRRLILGSVAERVLRLASLPVLLIPGMHVDHAGGETDAARNQGLIRA